MPRIRKKTSKRVSTHQREKIKHKVSETRKKSKKAAKKNPQWKSKQKKDPGVPNNFPFKDEVLAEVAEARRKAAELKQLRKDEARKAKASLKNATQDEDESSGEGEDAPMDQDAGETGILTLDASTKALRAPKPSKRNAAALDDDDDDVPMLADETLPDLAAALDRADVIVEVLDARDPLPCRSTKIEAFGKPVVFVLTKTDLAPRESVTAWAASIRSSGPTPLVLFRASSAFLPTPANDNGKGKQKALESRPTTDALGADALLATLSSLNAKNVAVVGPTNVGKSALLNSLAHRVASPVYNLATSAPGHSTTGRPLSVSVGAISFIDTAGYSPLYGDVETEDDERARDLLLRCRGRIDRVKEPLPALEQLVLRAPVEDLMLLYNLPAFAAGSCNTFLTTVARAKNCLNKDGTADLVAAARIVLKDWNTGAFSWYTQPPNSTPSAAAEDADGAVLNACMLRKDLRRARGSLVRLVPGVVDEREIDTHSTPAAAALPHGVSQVRERAPKRIKVAVGDDDDEEEDDAEATDGDSEDDEDADEDEEAEDKSGYESDNNDDPVTSVGSKKRQRKEAAAAKSEKKVSFAAVPASKKAPKRIANASAAKKGKKALAVSGDAYDFGKFF